MNMNGDFIYNPAFIVVGVIMFICTIGICIDGLAAAREDADDHEEDDSLVDPIYNKWEFIMRRADK